MYGLGAYIYRGEELPDAAKDSSEAEVTREKYEFEFKKHGNEVIGANDSASYIKLIGPYLKDPSNVLHKKLYLENKDTIVAAQNAADEELEERYVKLHELYNESS